MADIVSVRRSLNQGSAQASSSYLETRRSAFTDPWDVVLDPNLTSSEKKEILSGWASAARAIDGCPDGHAGTEGAAAWWDDLAESLRLVNAEIAALSRPRAVVRPGHLRPPLRSRSLRAD